MLKLYSNFLAKPAHSFLVESESFQFRHAEIVRYIIKINSDSIQVLSWLKIRRKDASTLHTNLFKASIKITFHYYTMYFCREKISFVAIFGLGLLKKSLNLSKMLEIDNLDIIHPQTSLKSLRLRKLLDLPLYFCIFLC